jgi:putative ABC transport system permease protein
MEKPTRISIFTNAWSLAMNQTNFILTIRSLRKNLLYGVLVVAGLAVGIMVLQSSLQWSIWHFSFDKSYQGYQRIYRLTIEEQREGFYRHMARAYYGDIIQRITLSDAFSQIDLIGRLAPYRRAVVKIEDNEFYENFAYSCDPAWLKIFSPKVLAGQKDNLLEDPFTAVITETLANKYFGDEDPVGKTIEIIHQFAVDPDPFTISAVIGDFPENSHLKVAILTSFENPFEYEGTAWTYLKLTDNASPRILEQNIKLFIESNFEADYVKDMTPRLQNIAEIHLHSHKPREIVPNVRFKSVIILLLTGIFVFILSWFNFTLLSVSQHQLNINRLVYQWQLGSGKKELFGQFLVNYLIIGSFSLILGILLTLLSENKIARLTGELFYLNHTLFILIFLFLVLLLIGSAALTAAYSTNRLYRYLKFRYLSARAASTPDAARKNHFIRWAIIAEFIITFILISNLMLIQRQTNYATKIQMGSEDPYTIQIPNLHRNVINQYDLFREKMLESPLIADVTGTMEEPTGMTMDAVKFDVNGFDTGDEKIYLFPAEENFLRFYDIQLLYGEDMPKNYNPSDTFEYFVLNESAARMVNGTDIASLVGREMNLDFYYPNLIGPGRIGGISEDFYLSGLDYEITPMVIFPKHTWLYCFAVKINGPRDEAEAYLKSVWDELFPDFPLKYQYTQDLIDDYYSTERTEIKIRMIYSIISVLIAGMGLFALSGIFLSRKMKSASIRKIHGAGIGHIMVNELLYYLYISLISSAIAVLPSYFLMEHWLRNFYYRLPIPIYYFVLTSFILVMFSWISVFYHTWKLARLKPADMIRV